MRNIAKPATRCFLSWSHSSSCSSGRKLYTEASWAALYQQSPFIVGGGIFPIEKLQHVTDVWSYAHSLRGFKVYADKVTGSKEVRAEPFAAQVQGGNVFMCAGHYQNDLLDEMVSFPNGKYRDQVDACSGAFNRLVSGPIYNLFGGAVDWWATCATAE
jgi:hypothetical protein